MSETCVAFRQHADDMESNLHFRFGWKSDRQSDIDNYRIRHQKTNARMQRNDSWSFAIFPNIKFQTQPGLDVNNNLLNRSNVPLIKISIVTGQFGFQAIPSKQSLEDIFWRLLLEEPVPVPSSLKTIWFQKPSNFNISSSEDNCFYVTNPTQCNAIQARYGKHNTMVIEF